MIGNSKEGPTRRSLYFVVARDSNTFKESKAHGPGVYVSAKGGRYEGQFVNGKLDGLNTHRLSFNAGAAWLLRNCVR